MPVQLLCPACKKKFRLSDRFDSSKSYKCSGCGGTLIAPDRARDSTVDESAAESRPASIVRSQAELPRQIGKFQVRGELGTGAFGRVFHAFDPDLEREVALKVPHVGHLDAETRERFLREAKAAARLRHPHIVPIHEAGKDAGQLYIASAYIKGQTLAEALKRGPWEWRRAAELVRKLAEALHYAHEQGIVHRDVKPGNILLDEKGEPHLLDFGLASLQDAAERMTVDGAVLGTPAYMSPEQAQGARGKAVPASDQYSLGIVLYELLSSDVPFSGQAGYVISSHVQREPPPLPPHVPRELDAICMKAMAKQPSDRHADCAAMANVLRGWLLVLDLPEPKIITRDATVQAAKIHMTLTPPTECDEAKHLRKVLVLDRVRKLLRLHNESVGSVVFVAIIVGVVLGFFSGLVAGVSLFAARPPTYEREQVALATGLLIGILICLATSFLAIRITLRGRAFFLEELIRDLLANYPLEVSSWGGEAVLRNVVTVEALVQLLEAKLR